MAESILVWTDFVTGAQCSNVQGLLYSGYGQPLNQISALTASAMYVDLTSGVIWTATSANSVSAWKPFASIQTNNIAIDNDIQEGDFVGIFGAGTWSLSGNLNTSRYGHSGFGSQNAAVVGGGTNLSSTELFNGSTWSTSSNNLNQTTNLAASMGSQNAGLITAGSTVATYLTTTNLFNGSTWSTSGNTNQSKNYIAGVGSQNAGLIIGGTNNGTNGLTFTEYFNGTIWTVGPNLNQSKYQIAGIGSLNAGVAIAGQNGTTYYSTTEIFNGSTWIFGTNLVQSRSAGLGAGSQNSGLMSGGYNGSAISSSEVFNGITWSLSGNVSQSKYLMGGGGSQNAGVVSGGFNGSIVNTTELHSQNVYRKLTYTNINGATNFGVAINTNSTSLTANLLQADVSNPRLPGLNFFGLSPYTYENTRIYLESARSLTTTNPIVYSAGQMSITVTTANTNVCNGLLVEVLNCSNAGNNGLFPVVNYNTTYGTQLTVRNPNGVNVATTNGTETVRLVWGNRLSGLTCQSITVSGGTATVNFSAQGNLSTTQFTRLVRVGGVVYVPFSTTSGTNGSQYNYGTYRINNCSITNGIATVSYTTTNLLPTSESFACSSIEIWQQLFVEPTTGGPGWARLGYNGRMRATPHMPTDDASLNVW